jgi:hypothetical protein
MTVHEPRSPTDLIDGRQSPRIHWLGWAAYLGASWTWCIGMFLPVLLVRDYGFWGWVVFAVPNVVGAAAMGWVMNSRERSLRVIESHRFACVAFSLVTIVFHVFFASWFVRGFIGDWAVPALVAVALVVWLVGRKRQRADVAMACVALFISALVFVILVAREAAHPTGTDHLVMKLGGDELVWLGAVCLFGFAFCPYLDLTFHRARLETNDDEAKSAFQIGFGVFFLAMILFTLWYSRFLVTTQPVPRFAIPLIVFLVVHVLIQSGYTCALHYREVRKHVNSQLAIVFLLIVLAGVIFFGCFNVRWPFYAGWQGEVIYRYFMSFYGLIFPAYVWLCMIPLRRRPLIPPVFVFAIGTALAVPFYWRAFIVGDMVEVSYGLGLLAIARVLLYIPHPGAKFALSRM